MTASLAASYDLVIFDLDGVVYLGSEAIPGAPDGIRATVDGGTAVAFVTNNASRRAREVAELLRSLGVPAQDDEVVTSGAAAARMLAADLRPGAPVLVVGSDSLREELRAVGLTPVGSATDEPVAVVQGYSPTLGWADLAEGCLAVRAGARWVATNTDATFPSKRGPVPGNGSLVAALTVALGGRQPDVVVGKPQPGLFQVAAQRGGERALVVGDRLDTDIEGAIRAGMESLLVLTGVNTAADVVHAPSGQRPTHLATDLRGLSEPDSASRVPVWRPEGVEVGGWRVAYSDSRLELTGPDGAASPEPLDAVRAIAAAAWANPGWKAITGAGTDATRLLTDFGLAGNPRARAASVASADR